MDLIDDKPTLVQVMTWCRQALNHYLRKCSLRSLSPYGIARPQYINLKNYSLMSLWVTWVTLSSLWKKECVGWMFICQHIAALHVDTDLSDQGLLWSWYSIYDDINSELRPMNNFEKCSYLYEISICTIQIPNPLTTSACVIFHDNLIVLTGAKICVNMRAMNWITVKCHYSIRTWILHEMGTCACYGRDLKKSCQLSPGNFRYRKTFLFRMTYMFLWGT